MSQDLPSGSNKGQEPSANSVDLVDLKRKSVRGGMVTMVSQAITVGIQLTSTVVLARLLSPEDYGVLAMVMAVTAFAGIFREMGLSAAAIQKKGLTREQQSNLFWLNLAMGILLTVIVAGASPLVAWFYGKPELVAVTLALSLTFVLSSLSTQHGAMMIRNMQFGRKAVASISGSLVTLAVAVCLALQGYSYWALVWGMLAGALVTSLLTLYLSPFRPGLLSKGAGIRDMLGFGANVTSFKLVNYFSRNLDNILIGKFAGAIALGVYGRAYQLLMFPITNLRGPIEAVAFPVMSKLAPNSPEFRAYYCELVRILAWLTMPLMVFLYINNEQIVLLMLGDGWNAVSPLFSILALVGFIQPVASLRGLLLLSSGDSRRFLYSGCMGALTVSTAFCLGSYWGEYGVAWAYVVATWSLLVPMQIFCTRNVSVRWSDLFVVVAAPVLTSISLVFILLIFVNWYDFNGDVVRLLFTGVLSSVYLIAMALTFPTSRKLVVGLIKRGIGNA